MKIVRAILIILIIMHIVPVMVYSGNDSQPLVISRKIRLRIPDIGLIHVTKEVVDKKITPVRDVFLGAEKSEKDFKVTLRFTKGKFNQISETVCVDGKVEKEQNFKTYPEDSKIVRKYTLLKDASKPKKIIYTFLSL